MIADPKTYRIEGVVIDSNTLLGVEGLKVEVWDKDSFFNDALGTAQTNAQGAFEIVLDANRFQDFFERVRRMNRRVDKHSVIHRMQSTNKERQGNRIKSPRRLG